MQNDLTLVTSSQRLPTRLDDDLLCRIDDAGRPLPLCVPVAVLDVGCLRAQFELGIFLGEPLKNLATSCLNAGRPLLLLQKTIHVLIPQNKPPKARRRKLGHKGILVGVGDAHGEFDPGSHSTTFRNVRRSRNNFSTSGRFISSQRIWSW